MVNERNDPADGVRTRKAWFWMKDKMNVRVFQRIMVLSDSDNNTAYFVSRELIK